MNLPAQIAQKDNITVDMHLTGVDKAAIFLLSLPDAYVTKIFNALYVDEVKDLSVRMATLGTIPSEVVEKLYLEMTEKVATVGAVYGSYESTERLLSKIYPPEKVREIMEEIRGPAGRTVWEKLSNVNEEILANFLKNEYPQTVAVVISRLSPSHAAKVFALLPDQFALDVINRMLKLEVVQREILDSVEETLKTEFMHNLARTQVKDPYEQMAEVFNAFDRSTESRFMSALEQRNEEAAERIKALMFTFDDLVKLDSSGVQTVIRVADKSRLALALKGANETIKDMFFKNMSERAAKLLREDMESLGMVKIKAVDEAQQEIVNQTKELMNRGEISVSSGEDGDQYVG